MKRSTAVLVSMAALILVGCGSNPASHPSTQPTPTSPQAAQQAQQTQAPRTIAVKISQPVESLSQLEVYVARAKGFFAEEGLAVDQIAARGGGPDVAALLAGDVQFNVGPDSYHINLLENGQKTLNVFNYQNQSIITMAINKNTAARLGLTDKTPLDQRLKMMKGLKIGITKPGAVTDNIARYYAQRAGLDPDKDMTLVAVGSNESANAALESGKIDILVVSVPQPEASVQKGAAVQFLSVGEDPQFKSFMMNSVHVTEQYARQNPDAVRRFVRAMEKACAWVQSASPDDIARAIEPYLPYDHDLLVAGVKQVKAADNPSGKMTRDEVATTLAVMGVKDVTVDQVWAQYTEEFMSKQ